MAYINAKTGLAGVVCIVLGAMLLSGMPVFADSPTDLPAQAKGLGKGLLKKHGQEPGGGMGTVGKRGPAIQNRAAQQALTNWQAMPVSGTSRTPGLMRVKGAASQNIPLEQPAKPAGGERDTSEEKEEKDKVRVRISGTQSLEMMVDKTLNSSREAMYSQIINKRAIPQVNTVSRSASGALRIHGYTAGQVNNIRQGRDIVGNQGVSFEGGELYMMEDIFQSGLR